MKIMTLNVWGSRGPLERQGVLREAIGVLSPDVLCLQEVAQEGLLTSWAYPTRLRAAGSELAILSRFPASTSRVFTFSSVSPLEPHQRQALFAKLKLPEQSLWVVTTHLAWKAQDEATRIAQAEELLAQVAPLGEMVLLSGDFNASPTHPPIERIRRGGFCDLFALLHPEDPGITWDNKNPFIQSHNVRFPDRRIDYLFLHEKALKRLGLASCDVVCSAATAEGLYPSDHYGVLCDLRL